MNSKLNKLAEQAGFHWDEHSSVTERRAGVFAELIVKELVSIVANQGMHMRVNHLAERLRQHFKSDK